ncbi:MAG: methyl-accepting chemotaxis protein [Actinomycetaceae bacterium]|nr:methyl-accepting chemotaxis protein [Actinomycetaceae bacterium]
MRTKFFSPTSDATVKGTPDATVESSSDTTVKGTSSLSMRVLTLTVGLLLSALLIGILGIFNVSRVYQASQEIAHLDELSYQVAQTNTAMLQVRLKVVSIPGVSGTADKEKYLEELKEGDAQLREIWAKIEQLGGLEVMPSWLAYQDAYSKWEQIRDTAVIPPAMADDRAGYKTGLTDGGYRDNRDAYQAAFKESLEQINTEIAKERDEIKTAFWMAIITISLVFTLAILIGLFVALRVLRSISTPTKQMRDALGALANGDLSVSVNIRNNDEIGQMGQAFNRAVLSLRELLSTAGDISRGVKGTSDSLQGIASAVSTEVNGVSTQASSVAGAAETVSRNVETVAAGAEEMGASIREISTNSSEAARVAAEAATVAQQTNQIVAKLGVSSQQIGEVVKTITTIAEQTNLLALNATIEAARAGESGKGFAVVAGEVKDLAADTAHATEEIGNQVTQIQADSDRAVEAIENINAIIASINDYQTTIAAAVEEQTATTNEMSRSVQEAARGAAEIAENIRDVAESASASAKNMGDMGEEIIQLNGMSQRLDEQMSQFQIG